MGMAAHEYHHNSCQTEQLHLTKKKKKDAFADHCKMTLVISIIFYYQCHSTVYPELKYCNMKI